MTTAHREGDRDGSFAQWGREHAPAVRGYLLAMVRRHDAAEDLTQEVFCRAWQAWDRYREEGRGRAYLLRIADRLLCDRARKAGREITLDDDAWRRIEPAGAAEDPRRAADRAEAAGQLAQAMDRLSVDQRRVLLLRYYGQFTFAEIAQQIGCPLGTALSHCRRGLLALRKTLVEKD